MRNFFLKYRNPKRLTDYFAIKFLGKKIAGFDQLKNYFTGKTGLEIGGPSSIFQHNNYIPVYAQAKRVDGCNFSNHTVCENTIQQGLTYDYDGAEVGYQYITDATDLGAIPDASYDFILSSHSLEHIANPFKALKEWLRVLKKGGLILIIVPDPNYTFDNKRPVTGFEHMMCDFNNNTGEDDLTHVEEILSLHDVSIDPGVTSYDEFQKRSYDNFNNRCLHHHVFDIALLKQIFEHLNVQTILINVAPPFNLIIAGIK